MTYQQYWSQRSLSITGATGVTFVLFLIMQMLIGQEIKLPPEPGETRILRIAKEIAPPKPRKPTELLEPVKITRAPIIDGIEIPMQPREKIPSDEWKPKLIGTPIEVVTNGVTDGELMVLSMIEPSYPTSAAIRGIEGYVIVEFTVTNLGRVRDAHITATDQPGIFDRDALRAIMKFRFKPRIIADKAVDAENISYKFLFRLNN